LGIISFNNEGTGFTMTLFIIIIATLAFLPMVIWLDGELNKNDDFLEVEEWHNFQSKMEKKK
jgi:hypothetical protein